MSGEREFVVLSREWCHLCHELIAALEPIAADAGWRVRVLDVDADPELEAEWDELVPVVLVDGRELCHYHLDEPAIRAHIADFG